MDGVVLFAGAATPFYTRTLTSRCRDGDKYRAIWFRRLSCGVDTARRNKTKCGLIVFIRFTYSTQTRSVVRPAAAAAGSLTDDGSIVQQQQQRIVTANAIKIRIFYFYTHA